jgi:hypothetical protein
MNAWLTGGMPDVHAVYESDGVRLRARQVGAGFRAHPL